MKKKFLCLFLVAVMCLGVFSGCNKIKLSGGPDTNAPVTSNGGLVTQKGDYLYFVNGIETDITTLEDGDNDYNKVNYSAIYRAKTSEGNLIYDENEKLKDVELLVPKIVGCDNADFFIFGDYLYYATPATGKDSSYNVRFDLLEFYSCKLDGTKTKKLYETDEYGENAKFNMISKCDKVYIEIFDGSKFIVLEVQGQKLKEETVYAEGENITSSIFPKVETFNKTNNLISDNETCIYYTRDLLESEKANYRNGNVVCKLNVVTGKTDILLRDNNHTVTLKAYLEDNLYFTAVEKNSQTSDIIIYHSNVNGNLAIQTSSAFCPVETDKDIFVIPAENGMKRGIVIFTEEQVMITTGYTSIRNVYSGKLTILKVDAQNIYAYDDAKSIIAIDIKSGEAKTLKTADEEIKLDVKHNFDVAGIYAYYFKTYKGDDDKTGYYLNRIDITKVEQEAEFLGSMIEEHIKTETEEE